MRHLAVIAVALVVTGCGIPPAITIASYAIDGVALVASGKTVKDHALSAAIGQDCAMFRVVTGAPVCTDYEPNPAAAAALARMPDSEEMLAATADGRVIRVAAARPALDTPVLVAADATPATPSAGDEGDAVPLLTMRDGRVIYTAASSEPTPVQAAVVQLSWVPPAVDLPAVH